MNRTGLLLAALLVLLAAAAPAMAAAAEPDRTLSISVLNPPGQEYYLDLLIEGQAVGTAGWDESYDPRMIDTLRGLNADGAFPAMTYRHSQLRGDLKGVAAGDGSVLHVFSQLSLSNSYWKNDNLGLPSSFRIVIITEDLQVVTSEAVSIRLLQTKMTYDFATGKITKQSTPLTLIYIYVALAAATLVTELPMLFPFGLGKAWRRAAAVNLCSIAVVTATVGWTLATIGNSWAKTEYPLIQIWMAIFETIAFVKLLGDTGFWRKVCYGLAANAVSAALISVILGKVMGYQ